MTIDNQTLQHIAHLARLGLEENELKKIQTDLEKFLALAQAMQSVDTSQTLPMAHPFDLTQRLREDTVSEPDQRECFQTIAPQVEKGYYQVPKVIE